MVEYNPRVIYLTSIRNPKKTSPAEVFVSLTDSDTIKARDVLINFATGYSSFQKQPEELPSKGFVNVREYKASGTGLQFTEDKFARGSIVVKKFHLEDGRVVPTFFYISETKNGLLEEPMVYKLNLDEPGVTIKKPSNLKPLTKIIERLEQNVNFARSVSALNKRWGGNSQILNKDKDFFIAISDKKKKLHCTIEVWKEGSVEKLKSKSEKKSPVRVGVFTPFPKPIPQHI